MSQASHTTLQRRQSSGINALPTPKKQGATMGPRHSNNTVRKVPTVPTRSNASGSTAPSLQKVQHEARGVLSRLPAIPAIPKASSMSSVEPKPRSQSPSRQIQKPRPSSSASPLRPPSIPRQPTASISRPPAQNQSQRLNTIPKIPRVPTQRATETKPQRNTPPHTAPADIPIPRKLTAKPAVGQQPPLAATRVSNGQLSTTYSTVIPPSKLSSISVPKIPKSTTAASTVQQRSLPQVSKAVTKTNSISQVVAKTQKKSDPIPKQRTSQSGLSLSNTGSRSTGSSSMATKQAPLAARRTTPAAAPAPAPASVTASVTASATARTGPIRPACSKPMSANALARQALAAKKAITAASTNSIQRTISRTPPPAAIAANTYERNRPTRPAQTQVPSNPRKRPLKAYADNEDDEYESDFIDDDEADNHQKAIAMVRGLFKRKHSELRAFVDDDDDDACMEATSAEIEREERESLRAAVREDAEEERKLKEEELRRRERKRRKMMM